MGDRIADSLCDLSDLFFFSSSQFQSTFLPCFPPFFHHYTFISPTVGRAAEQSALPRSHMGSGCGGGGGQACTLNRCPLQKVMVWDNYPSTSTCLLKMADSDVVTFQYETVVIRIWISFHSHSGSHPDNTCLTKSTRWNWPVSSISRAICATQLWITTMGKSYCHAGEREGLKIPRCAPRILRSREKCKQTQLRIH